MSSQSPEVSSSPFSVMDEGSTMKSKMDLYNTPRAKRFSERVADAISPNGKQLDDPMDSPSPPGDDDDDEYEPPPPKKAVRKRRSLIKYSDTAQRQRRKLRHNQKTIVESDDEYEEEEEVYRAKKQPSRQSSVGSDEGAVPAPKAKNGRRRRLRLQNTSSMATDTPDIDEDASPTFFPNKARSIHPSVAPIVVGTTSGVTKDSRRRGRPDHITQKLDRLRHYPHTDMLDLSKHLIIPARTPSPSTSSSPKRQDDNSSDGGESPIHIPDDAVMQHSETQESATPPPEPSTLESPQPVDASQPHDTDTKMESFADDRAPPSPIHYPEEDLPMQDTTMESPFRDMSIRSPIHDPAGSPTTPITPQPMVIARDEQEPSLEEKDAPKEDPPQRSYFGRVVGSMSRFFWGS